ncbi:MAG: phosphoglucosamine mutase [Pseudomonadota bacterium]|nr:phosphoglucosamine mutase [Pseudomonadota bacterium]
MSTFGTDGIRGRANVDIGPQIAMALGNALVAVLGPRIAVARDTRPSGPMLVAATIAGITTAGGEAVDLGVLPTSGLSALVARLGLSGGVMVTASHNPPADNGLKAVGSTGAKLTEAERRSVEARLGGALDHAAIPGGVTVVTDAGERYVAAVLDVVPRGRWLLGHTVAIDSANGAAAGLAGRVLVALGARVITLGDGAGGAINVGCGAMAPDALVATVAAHEASAGIALDGDGDRGVLVTAEGAVLDGDALLWLCAEGEVVVGTIMSNGGLEAGLAARGIELLRTPVGDAHVAAAMRETGAAVGGEPSGHVLFADGLPTADGLVATLRALHPDPRGLAARLSGLPRFAQLNLAVKIAPARIPVTDSIASALRSDGARVVVRASGTEPVVRLMVEHADPEVARVGLEQLRSALIG